MNKFSLILILFCSFPLTKLVWCECAALARESPNTLVGELVWPILGMLSLTLEAIIILMILAHF